MTTFKEIRGKLIRTLDTDPTPASNYIGEIWYNKTIGVLKGVSLGADTWSSGGTYPLSILGGAGGGPQNAAFMSGGESSGAEPDTNNYDGSAWTASGNLGTARYYHSGTGTQTAGLVAGGSLGPFATLTNATEEYDGSVWSGGGNAPLNFNSGSFTGIQTAAISAGGNTTPYATAFNTTLLYNGAAWTTGNSSLNTASERGASGTQTAALVFGGAPNLTATESWDGTSWTAAGNTNNGRSASSEHAGTQTAAIMYGGFATPFQNRTELWDGTSWTESTPLTQSRAYLAGCSGGNRDNALAVGGPGAGASTEEWNPGGYTTQTLTTS